MLVVGDSLSAEYGLARGSGWVALLEQRLAREKLAVAVVNASISGDTTSGGRSRLPALLAQHRPTHRDHRTRRQRCLARPAAGHDARQPGARWRARPRPPAPGCCWSACRCRPTTAASTASDFAALFASVAKAEGAALVPFLLKGVADAPKAEQLFQADRIHPNAQAQPTMLDNVWPVLKPLLK